MFKDLKAALKVPDILNGMNVYGLPKLWSITQDAFQCNDELLKTQDALKLGLQSVSEILKLPFARRIRMHLLIESLKNL